MSKKNWYVCFVFCNEDNTPSMYVKTYASAITQMQISTWCDAKVFIFTLGSNEASNTVQAFVKPKAGPTDPTKVTVSQMVWKADRLVNIEVYEEDPALVLEAYGVVTQIVTLP